jgi:hypothetical protein
VWWLVGGSGEVAFRALALAAMWVALTLMYVLLRRAFGVLPTLVAVLAFWSNPLIIHYAFFARPYALLLAATVGFCLAYDSSDSTLRSIMMTAAAAALLCTIHYFGIFALASVVVGDALTRRAELRASVRRALPTAAGPLVLATLLPFYRGQMQGFSHTSWLPQVTAEFAINAIVEILAFPILIAALLILAWWVTELLRERAVLLEDFENHNVTSSSLQSMAGLSGLLLVPLLVTLFSVLDRTNAVVDRYMIAALLGFTPLLAMVASRSAVKVLILMTVFLVMLSWWKVREVEEGYAGWNHNRDELIAEYGAIDDGLPIVTLDTHEAFVLYEYAPKIRNQLMVVDLSGWYQNSPSFVIAVDYESTVKWRRLYPDMPRLVTLDDLRGIGEFHLVATTEAPIVPSGPPPFQRVRGVGWNAVYRVHPD